MALKSEQEGQDGKGEAALAVSGTEDERALPGVVRELGFLGTGAVITEEGMANLFKRHVTSVKRAVRRGELPPPTRLFGGNAWTAGALIRHIETRLDQAAKEAERNSRKLANLMP